MRRTLAALAVLFMLAFPGATPPAQAAPSPKPVLSVELWPAEQSLGGSYETQDAVFSGQVSLDNAPFAKFEVFLMVCDNPDWPTWCSPNYVVFWGPGSAPFNLTVRVPQLAACQTARIWVESRATYEDVDVAGNISAPVFLVVGGLPENPDIPNGGGEEPFYGQGTGGSGAVPVAPVLAAAVIVVVAVALVSGLVLWRRARRAKEQ